MTEIEFQGFPKIARLSREVIVTEKIDGTNAQILITDTGELFVGSRTRWITPADDNHGFAKWVNEHKEEIMTLGPGRHFGEWWGSGINRGYNLSKGEKRFSLFNISRWALFGTMPKQIITNDPTIIKFQEVLPECCGLVPELWRGIFNTSEIDKVLNNLKLTGSIASPGFMKPEGIVVFHTSGNVGFKKTIENDDIPKTKVK